jgi:hypothetical protein
MPLSAEPEDRGAALAAASYHATLDSREGPFRLVVPGEKRHARWVREVTSFHVEEAR